MDEDGTIKRLGVQNKTHSNNNKALICCETKEEAQREIDINQYPEWKASLYYSRHKIQEYQEECQTDTNILTEGKNKKKPKLITKDMKTLMNK